MLLSIIKHCPFGQIMDIPSSTYLPNQCSKANGCTKGRTQLPIGVASIFYLPLWQERCRSTNLQAHKTTQASWPAIFAEYPSPQNEERYRVHLRAATARLLVLLYFQTRQNKMSKCSHGEKLSLAIKQQGGYSTVMLETAAETENTAAEESRNLGMRTL